MAKKILGLFLFVGLSVALGGADSRAGEDLLKKELADLNRITGNEPLRGALKSLVDDKKHAQAMLTFAIPAAKNKELTYNAALVLGLVAAETKDMKSAETYLKVCMEKAARLQSVEKLKESYGLLIELYYDYKQYADAARISKELLELNTDDEKQREVRQTYVDRTGKVDISEGEEGGFKTALRLRPYVYEYHVKAVAKQGKYDQALRLVDNLLKADKDWIDLSLKGWVLREAARFDEAAAVYEDVIQRITKDDRFSKKTRTEFIEQYRYDLSGVYVDLKKVDRAAEHLEFLIKSSPTHPGYYNDLGYIWADHDMKLDEAEKHIRKALELDKERRKKRKGFDPKTDHDSGAYLDSLGWVLYKQKKHEEAKGALLKAIEDKSAQHLEIYDHLGDVHMALGEREAAIAAWTKGLGFSTDSRRDVERKAVVEKKLEKAKGSK